MEYPTIRLVFDRKKIATSTTKGLVQIEVRSGSKRKWISTGVKVFAKEWHNSKMVIGRMDAAALNSNLTMQLESLQRWINDLRRDKLPFDFDMIAVETRTPTKSPNFIDYVEKRIEERKDIAESTKRTHRKLVGALRAFKQIRLFSDLTKQKIMAYDEWLHKRGYLQATVHSYHKFMKVYINEAIRQEIISDTPYRSIKIDVGKRGVRKYLNDVELQKVMSCEITDKSIRQVRDLFVFQCFTGLAYSDLMHFDFTKVDERNGKYVFHGIRQKTGENFYIVLLSPAVEILKKYNFVLPVICNQQYNLRLKVVSSFARISQPITSHMARHTFAVYCLNHGVQIETLAKMMGHADIKTTQLYAKIVNSTVEEAFDNLEKQISI